jgi:hypothetical protein
VLDANGIVIHGVVVTISGSRAAGTIAIPTDARYQQVSGTLRDG